MLSSWVRVKLPAFCKLLSNGIKRNTEPKGLETLKAAEGALPAPQGSGPGWETVHRTARRICGSDPLPRRRFSRGSRFCGLTNKGDGIGGIECLCGEQNRAKRLITEPRHTGDFVTGS